MKVRLGICARDKKATSKPMRAILGRLDPEHFDIVTFGDEMLLEHPVEDWPVCDALIAFFSTGFPLDKAQAYEALHQPLILNDLAEQWTLLDRRGVYARLVEHGIPVARHVVLDRDRPDFEFEEHEDYVVVDGVRVDKPFVEKPVDAEDHRVIIYYPVSAGGGSKRLFRKVGDRSSSFHPECNTVRRDGSYIYEEFLPTQGTDVKVYTVGPDYGHAEARKSPSLDGRVLRDAAGKEVRYPVILSTAEKAIARSVVLAFKQNVCGFDLLRTAEGSFVCDVNGWSFVKNSTKYYDDCALLLQHMILSELRPDYVPRPQQEPEPREQHPDELQQPAPDHEELRCVAAILRHGDRTPKQKMKMRVTHPRFLRLFRKYGDISGAKELKLKRAVQLQDVLDATLHLLALDEAGESDSDELERRDKLVMMRDVLQTGRFSGINRKVQLKPLAWADPDSGEEEEDSAEEEEVDGPEAALGAGLRQTDSLNSVQTAAVLPAPPTRRVTEALLVLKWGGTLTAAGCEQAQTLGSNFRHAMYPGDGGLLRLHSTYRHDLKIYTSDEGRVQMTAAAFAKGFLDLEGELTPILVSLVHCDKKATQMLDGAGVAHEELAEVKSALHGALRREGAFDAESEAAIAPTGDSSVLRAMAAVGNPREHLRRLHAEIGLYVAELQAAMLMAAAEAGSSDDEPAADDDADDEAAATDDPAPQRETLHLIHSRWRKLHKDLYSQRRDTYDLSKVPDVYDCIKHDLWHNAARLQARHLRPIFDLVKPLADVVIPQEYGVTREQKLAVARKVCNKLLRKLMGDLMTAADPASRSFKLDCRHAEDLSIKSPLRDVRSRLYFTSESHMHTFLNILRFRPEGAPPILADETAASLDDVPELNYLTRFVIRLFERTTLPADDPARFRVELSFSPGADTSPEARDAADPADEEPTPQVLPLRPLSVSLTLDDLIGRLAANVDDPSSVGSEAASVGSPARPIALEV